jgi:hypothetical protein
MGHAQSPTRRMVAPGRMTGTAAFGTEASSIPADATGGCRVGRFPEMTGLHARSTAG